MSNDRGDRVAYLLASGDLRHRANVDGWPAQEDMERRLTAVFAERRWRLERAHDIDPLVGHGFLSSQRAGLDVLRRVPTDAPVVVAVSIWQYSHHVLSGLRLHRGPILTVANFDGRWSGLVGMLNLNASLRKAGVPYATAWSVDFADDRFLAWIDEWMTSGAIRHDRSHVRPWPTGTAGDDADRGRAVAAELRDRRPILGVFDEGCMGMYNAIIDDELLAPLGLFKERLSQSALYAEMRRVPADEAHAALAWLLDRGMRFDEGADPAVDLTREQVLDQLRMYIAALRIADDFGLDAIGIQYQQGLTDLVPASDLAEGLLNDADRPPVRSRDGARVLWPGAPLPHFNEVDEGCAVDALVTNRVWTALGLDPATTLHDVRWGEDYEGRFVWVFMISGAVPPSHLAGGYRGAVGMRQHPRFFPLGGATLRGVSKPGEFVWSRVHVEDGAVRADLGRGTALELPEDETERRWRATSPEWPIMHAVLHGVSRDQLMGRHPANHIQVAYAPDAASADRALRAKAAALTSLGIEVSLCGDVAA
jgi:L-fucose isomerase-like protein